MRIYCKTNLDGYKSTVWPRAFAFPPRVGDWVEGQGSDQMKLGTMPRLRVVSVTHRMSESHDDEPVVTVELHK